jgi:Fe-Mn family superoxide dismutase
VEKTLHELSKIITLAESTKEQLVLAPLPYARDDLDPVLSAESLVNHHNKLAQAYVTRYNNGEGDAEFNQAGAFLHNIFFPQLQAPMGGNKPHGVSAEFIERHHGSFDQLKSHVETQAMGIQGSGWVYLARNGEVKIIKNHQIRQDIVLLIDWWEHAFILDYGTDKAKYLKNIWRIINWSVVNDRIHLNK